MESKELSIQTLNLEIHVIRVGGHKMTLSVFDQLEKFPINFLSFGPDGTYDANEYPEEIIPCLQQFTQEDDFKIYGWIHRNGSNGSAYWLFVTWDKKPYKIFLGGPNYRWPNRKNKQNPDPYNMIPSELPQLFIAT